MAITTINVGSAPNDGTGDPLRVAFQTTNTNFLNITADGGDEITVLNPTTATDTTLNVALQDVLDAGGGGGAVSSVNGDTGAVVVDLQSVTNEGSETTDDVIFRLDANKYIKINSTTKTIEIWDDTIMTGIYSIAIGDIITLQNDAGNLNEISADRCLLLDGTNTLEIFSDRIAFNGIDYALPNTATSRIATLLDIPSLTGYVPYTDATSDVNLGEFGLLAGNVEFDNTPTNIPTNAGSAYWNDTDGTLDLILKGGNVKLQIGQEQVVRVVNKTATNVNLLEANYQAVRVTGAQGQRLKVDLAQATSDLLSAETIGLVTETINNNQEGFITTSGLVRNINTTGSLQGETWADGDIIYLSPTTAGNLTKVKPVAPNHLVIIGYVIHAHATQGSIFVKVDNGYELDELHNVGITTPLNNQTLVYDIATQVWKNKVIVEDSIVDGVTDKAPSQNVVFDALALKSDKSMSAYSFRVNNTNATANETETTYRANGQQVYSGTITWTGTTAPSGATTHTYNWVQVGNLVTLNINLIYGAGGSALTSVMSTLPTDCPNPIKPTGLTGANNVLYIGAGALNLGGSAAVGAAARVILRSNTANTGFEIECTSLSGSYRNAYFTIQYYTN